MWPRGTPAEKNNNRRRRKGARPSSLTGSEEASPFFVIRKITEREDHELKKDTMATEKQPAERQRRYEEYTERDIASERKGRVFKAVVIGVITVLVITATGLGFALSTAQQRYQRNLEIERSNAARAAASYEFLQDEYNELAEKIKQYAEKIDELIRKNNMLIEAAHEQQE